MPSAMTDWEGQEDPQAGFEWSTSWSEEKIQAYLVPYGAEQMGTIMVTKYMVLVWEKQREPEWFGG